MQVLQGDIPLMRMMGTSEPVLSGKEIEDRVLARIKHETGEKSEERALKDRPLSQLYIKSHRDRLKQGHKKAILWVGSVVPCAVTGIGVTHARACIFSIAAACRNQAWQRCSNRLSSRRNRT